MTSESTYHHHDHESDGDGDGDDEEADDFWVPGIWGFEGVHASPLYKEESLTRMMKKNIIDEEQCICSEDDPNDSLVPGVWSWVRQGCVPLYREDSVSPQPPSECAVQPPST